MVSYIANIKVPLETVWQHFIYKIEHPENFVPGASHVIIKEKTPDFVIREMDIVLPDGTKACISEKITQAHYSVGYLILHHPVYSGYVDNRAEKISENKTKITFSLHRINKKQANFSATKKQLKMLC